MNWLILSPLYLNHSIFTQNTHTPCVIYYSSKFFIITTNGQYFSSTADFICVYKAFSCHVKESEEAAQTLAKLAFKGDLPKHLKAAAFDLNSLAWLHCGSCQENKPGFPKAFRSGVTLANLVWNRLLTKMAPPCAPTALAWFSARGLPAVSGSPQRCPSEPCRRGTSDTSLGI